MNDSSPHFHPTLALWIATAGGLGHLRPGPGTWGSIGAALLAWPLTAILPQWAWSPVMMALGVGAFLAGLAVCPAAIRHFRRGDPSEVVIDEVAGVWLALAVVPGAIVAEAPYATLTSTLLCFRCFDVAKPWPVRSLENLPGGLGIMVDDGVAGLLAGAVTVLLLA